MSCVFDLETNGLLPELHTIHCVVARDENGTHVFHNDPVFQPRHGTVAQGLAFLENHPGPLVAHNGIGFDYPAIKKLHPEWDPHGRCLDSMVMLGLRMPSGELFFRDLKRTPRPATPGGMSLACWGTRLGIEKGEYDGGWETFSQKMLDYCVRDVEVLANIVHTLTDLKEESVTLEHDFANCIRAMERKGVWIDQAQLDSLIGRLVEEQFNASLQLLELFPGYARTYKTLVRQTEKTQWIELNPNSRHHIAKLLKERGFNDFEQTPAGKPKVDFETLQRAAELGIEGAKEAAHFFKVSKILGMAATGSTAWIKMIQDGRIHGRVNHNGAVTGRCTHSKPNLATIPSRDKDPVWGSECRKVFAAPPGKVLIGTDAKSLELRALAHYLSRWDGGEYAEMAVAGDVHTKGMQVTGVENRSVYKAAFYALIYGAGDGKLDEILGRPGFGIKFRQRMLDGIKGFRDLDQAVRRKAQAYGVLTGIDGRTLHCRSPRAALNTLLQAFGAIVVKRATVYACAAAEEHNADMVLHVHDEFLFETPEDQAQALAPKTVAAIVAAGESFNSRCPLDGDTKIGRNWSEVH